MFDKNYRALLIGTRSYKDERLPNLRGPINDVTKLATTLSNPNIGRFDPKHVKTLTDGSSHEITQQFESFLRNSKRDETLLFYYSGHGLRNSQSSLLLCGRNANPDMPTSTTVSKQRIDELVDDCPATVVIILDCCYSGGYSGGGYSGRFKSADLAEGSGLAEELAGNGRFVITSSRATERALDADEATGLSRFTAHLIRGIEGEAATPGSSYISISDLYRYVYWMMARDGSGNPNRSFYGEGDIPIANSRPKPHPNQPEPPKPNTAPPEAIRKRVEPIAWIAPTAMLLLAIIVLLMWQFRNLDVTEKVQMEGAAQIGAGDTATATLSTPDHRKYLEITFHLATHYTDSQMCVPTSDLIIALGSNGPHQPITSRSGEAAEIPLGGNLRTVQLTVMVKTTDPRCVMNLTVDRAILHN
ncbi:MAG: caspase family protein [Pseudonocardiaceae bacterium]